MPNWVGVVDALVDMGGEAAKAYVLDRLHSRMLQAPSRAMPSTTALEESPPRQGCPYCSITRCLAAAHRYLVRGRKRGDLEMVYQGLAHAQLLEAATVLNGLEPALPGTLAMKLTREIIDCEVVLSQPLSDSDLEVAISRVWDTSETAMTLAEGTNAGGGSADAGRQPCIQGEARREIV